MALPAKLKLGAEPVFVRVMDDLATTERSRWEVWAEVAHGRVSLDLFEEILAEEIEFIRSGANMFAPERMNSISSARISSKRSRLTRP